MAKYDVTYSCGHSGAVNLLGPGKERERKLEWYRTSAVCPECYEKYKEEKNQAERMVMVEKAKSYDLPDLVGSEKQIAWALKIRDEFIKVTDKLMAHELRDMSRIIFETIRQGNFAHESAKWWIETRESHIIEINRLGNAFIVGICEYLGIDEKKKTPDEVAELIEQSDIIQMPEDERYHIFTAIVQGEHPTRWKTAVTKDEIVIAAELEAERTIRPTEPKIETATKITLRASDDGSSCITIRTSEYNQDISVLLKKSGFVWQSGSWIKNQNANQRDTVDRIIEAAVHALSHGYVVVLPDKNLVEKVLSADYQPFQTRLIRSMDGEFSIKWGKDDGDFYESAKRLHGAHWNREHRTMRVPASSFLEVEDFAEKFDFALSDMAIKLVEKAKIVRDAALVGDVRPKGKIKPTGSKPMVLKIEYVDVSPDLKEDDSELLRHAN
jgi:hypothetical protein